MNRLVQSQYWSAHDLAIHEFENPTFLVDPIIPLGGLVLLHGKRGLGKTQLCLSLSNSIVNGTPFLNRFPTLKGTVLQVQVDMTPQIQQLRVRKVVDRLHLEGLYYNFPRVINITDLTPTSDFTEMVLQLQPALIIWDTLRKIHRFNENSSEAVQLVYSACNGLFPDPTHLFVHHDKKTVVEQQALDPEEAFRGSTDWLDSTDTSMQLISTLPKSSPPRLKLIFHKARTAPEFAKDPVLLEMDPSTMLMLPTSPLKDIARALTSTTSPAELLRRSISDSFHTSLALDAAAGNYTLGGW